MDYNLLKSHGGARVYVKVEEEIDLTWTEEYE